MRTYKILSTKKTRPALCAPLENLTSPSDMCVDVCARVERIVERNRKLELYIGSNA